MMNYCNPTATRIVSGNSNLRSTPGVYIADVARLTQDRSAIAADDLVVWLATMNITKRVIVAPFDWSDAICDAWRRHSFDVLRVSADNDNVATAAREIASRYARVYIATAAEDLTDWSTALPDTPIFVGCVQSSTNIVPAAVKARAAAIYYMQRFMFPLAPALACAA
jgi:hypothetical protein